MKFSTAALAATLGGARGFFHVLPHHRARPSQRTPLFGLLDDVRGDDYDLLGSSSSSSNEVMGDAFEIFLGDLVFSSVDPRVDIANEYERATDPAFLTWLEEEKIGESRDPEERSALKDLLDIILDVKKRVELSRMAEERAVREAEEAKAAASEDDDDDDDGARLTNADVLRRAAALDNANLEKEKESLQTEKVSFYDSELTPEIRLSYADMLAEFLGGVPRDVVRRNYDRFDAQFVKVLAEKAADGDAAASALSEALAVEQGVRMAAATESLAFVLAMGDPMRMEGAVVKLAREGKIDENFLLLLEANETRARDAGAVGPASLMKRLRKRAAEEKDKLVQSKEIRLIRKLLRADDAAEREKILEDAFTPKDVLLVPGTAENAQKALDGEEPELEKPVPDVPPPDFIDACKAVMINFGNLSYEDDRADLASNLKRIAAEAEAIATRIYGRGMTTREQQDRMWSETTTSIFDLERMELEAERAGEAAPWTDPNADDSGFLPGFDADGKMRVGGGS